LVQRVKFAFHAAGAHPRAGGGDKCHGRDYPTLHNRTILPFFHLIAEAAQLPALGGRLYNATVPL